MARWAQNETEFVLSVVPNKYTGAKNISLPPPIQDALGNPKYVKLVIKGNTVVIKKSDKKRSVT